MKFLIFLILPFLNKIFKKSAIYDYICDDDICVIDAVNDYNTTFSHSNLLKKYLSDEIIKDYEDCILSSNDGCETFWYIDSNYTQWKIQNESLSYLRKKPFKKWINIKE